jgi:hypothetical protein
MGLKVSGFGFQASALAPVTGLRFPERRPHRMNGIGFETLRSACTSRTYPKSTATLTRVVEEAVRGLERLGCHVRPRERCGRFFARAWASRTIVRVRLTHLESGAHTNTQAAFESASRTGPWDLGRLLRAIDGNQKPKKA